MFKFKPESLHSLLYYWNKAKAIETAVKWKQSQVKILNLTKINSKYRYKLGLLTMRFIWPKINYKLGKFDTYQYFVVYSILYEAAHLFMQDWSCLLGFLAHHALSSNLMVPWLYASWPTKLWLCLLLMLLLHPQHLR